MTQGDAVPDPLQAGSPLRTPRAAAVAGVIFSVLIAAFVLLRLSVPADPRVAGTWLTDSGRRTAVQIALDLVPFAGIAFLWFIGVLRDRVASARTAFSRPCSWAAACCSWPCSSWRHRSPTGS